MPNALINEKSPYLLQHAHNPVNWYAWNDESLALAKSLNKPILLSIGYSTCYWCHVMERECFENPEIAQLLNDTFVNIKVDREERPDIDKIYMAALQSITGSGGWPMNMFLTPDLKPFYGATYIPPKAKYGRSGIEDIILQIKNLWENNRKDVINSSEKITDFLTEELSKTSDALDNSLSEKCFNQSLQLYDDESGGFGSGNKFPRPAILDFLLQYYHNSRNVEALDIVKFTLLKMYSGGIFDHIDFGFHRYSVDNLWRVPHFEKMLYDQAQISNTLLDTYSITKNDLYLDIADKTLNYVLNFLLDPLGGFYSAEDAESAIDPEKPNVKREGYFYMWTKDDIDRILGHKHSEIFCHYYGIFHNGNTISDPHHIFGKSNVLFLADDIKNTAGKFNKTEFDIASILLNSVSKLKAERDMRPRPFLDKKIITSWNALMISSLSKAYSISKKHIYKTSAVRALSFLIYHLYDEKENTLYHRYIDGERKYYATLDDYAFLIKAILDFHNISFSGKLLKIARKLIDVSIEKFYDESKGGFFDTEKNQQDIIHRTKDLYDGAEPSGNNVMLENLLRAYIIFKDDKYYNLAEKSFKIFFDKVSESPFSYPYFIKTLDSFLNDHSSVIISGDLRSENFNSLLEIIYKQYLPVKNIIHYNNVSSKILPYLATYNISMEKTEVFICKNFICNLPVSSENDLQNLLKNNKNIRS